MILIFRKFIFAVFKKIIPISWIVEDIDNIKIKNCFNSVNASDLTRFYAEAKVFNLQNNSTKIIIGKNTHIRGELLIFAFDGKISIGNDCYIGEGTKIWSAENIVIGNNVLISHQVNIIDTDSHEINYKERELSFYELTSNLHILKKRNIKAAPIYLEDNAWISYNVSILKGVTIGRGAIVGAGSVVTHDVPPFTIVGGNPAKFISKINNEENHQTNN